MSKDMITHVPRLEYSDIINDDGFVQWDGAFAFGEALRTIGFVVLKNPPYRSDLLSKNYELAKKVFDLGVDHLTSNYAYEEIGFQRGYMPTLVEKGFLCGGDPDEKEVMCFGSFHNVPIREEPEYLPTVEAYYSACQDVAYNLMRALLIYLDPDGKDEQEALSWFRDEHEKPIDDSHMRHLNYPGDAELMACRHTDINMITLLPAATRGGLQVQTNDGRWIPVAPEKGDLIVNAGDMLNYISGGKILSTLHQVINPNPNPENPRYSIPFFYHPDHNKTLKVLDSCKDEPKENRRFKYDSILGYYLLYEVLHGIEQIPKGVTAEQYVEDYERWKLEGLPKR
ncbi:hypothetical protein K8I28_16575 [bacterium]|nr:hypothetical protein [bacterium]